MVFVRMMFVCFASRSWGRKFHSGRILKLKKYIVPWCDYYSCYLEYGDNISNGNPMIRCLFVFRVNWRLYVLIRHFVGYKNSGYIILSCRWKCLIYAYIVENITVFHVSAFRALIYDFTQWAATCRIKSSNRLWGQITSHYLVNVHTQ